MNTFNRNIIISKKVYFYKKLMGLQKKCLFLSDFSLETLL